MFSTLSSLSEFTTVKKNREDCLVPKPIRRFPSTVARSCIVVGYGNPNAGDDAVGQKVVARLKLLNLPHITACSVCQLTPELSGKLARTDVAIFVDACYRAQTNVLRISPLEACGCETTGSVLPAAGHSCDPRSLLALTQSVYGHFPQAWWVEVPANDFVMGHPLSDLAEQGVENAIQAIQQLIS